MNVLIDRYIHVYTHKFVFVCGAYNAYMYTCGGCNVNIYDLYIYIYVYIYIYIHIHI